MALDACRCNERPAHSRHAFTRPPALAPRTPFPRRLRALRLDGNALSGPLGPGFGNMSSLTQLSLRGNKLNGGLPDDLCSMGPPGAALSFDLSSNELSGTLPSVWAAPRPARNNTVMALALLDVSRNAIGGTLPASFANLSSAAQPTLLLAGNNLTGTLPAAWGGRTAPGSLVQVGVGGGGQRVGAASSTVNDTNRGHETSCVHVTCRGRCLRPLTHLLPASTCPDRCSS